MSGPRIKRENNMTTVEMEVRYAETDMMGIMHHSRYFPWFESVRTEFIKKIGISYSEMEQMGVLMPLTNASAHYIDGLKYEQRATVSCELTSISPARCEFYYTVRRISDGKITTTGTTSHGFVDNSFKPINLKKKFPKIYESLEKLLKKE